MTLPSDAAALAGALLQRFVADPMEQFVIQPLIPLSLGPFDVSLTNSTLWMLITVAVGYSFFFAATRANALIPGRMQSVAELAYEFVAEMVRDSVGPNGMKFFPYVFTLFIFILLSNWLGLLPSLTFLPHELHTFTTTSHIAVTLALGLLTISIVLGYSLVKNGAKTYKMFLPSGLPVAIAPLLLVIEIISFISRPISLGIRLFANMTAGHVILKVFAGFIVTLLGAGATLKAVSIIPFLGILAVTLLEILVGFLQAYIFAILTCIYLGDAEHAADH
ncbi:MAG: F0F1 ATP synthase subunit A [Pseudomonadota bacterium]